VRPPRPSAFIIALFGRRNVGKSSLLNSLVRQQVSIVSDVPGTTTDPVEKPMEIAASGAHSLHRHGRHRRHRGSRSDARCRDPASARPSGYGSDRRLRQGMGPFRGRPGRRSRAAGAGVVVVFNKIDCDPAGRGGRAEVGREEDPCRPRLGSHRSGDIHLASGVARRGPRRR